MVRVDLDQQGANKSMRKIVNSLLHGSKKTKFYLWMMLAILIMVFGGILFAIRMASFPMALFSLLAIGLEVAIYQSVSFRDILKDEKAGTKRKNLKKMQQKVERLQRDLEKQRKKTGNELVQELGIKALSAESFNQERPEEKEEKEKEPVIKKYNKKSIRKLMIKYRVKREHRKIIIDTSSTFHIRQCPAYLWKHRREVYFLLLEKEPRIIKISMEKIQEIGYKKMVEAKPSSDYQEFTEPSLITKLFTEFLPQYKEGSYRGKMGSYKNLYVVTPDICVTNTSAESLFDVLEVEFAVHDDVTNSRNYSEYYKTAYKINILWKDGVISTGEYKSRIKHLLNHVASEPIARKIYDELLQQLVEHKLITKEYASYYQELKK